MSDVPDAGPEVLIIPTGIANLASVEAGLRRAGAQVRTSRDPAELSAAAAVVLPGVGAFDAGLEGLRALPGMAEALAERIAADRPTLAVCLGLQLLLHGSEESPTGARGLGIVPGRATRFPDSVRVPQLGWNLVEADPACRLLGTGGYAYFANSYRLAEIPAGFACGLADHGGRFVAALERGNLLACQFHPELSGRYGAALLRRFVERAQEVQPC